MQAIAKKTVGLVLLGLLILSLTSCERKTVQTETKTHNGTLTDDQIVKLETKKFFFGHQSVGANIVQGIRDLEEEDPRLHLEIVGSNSPESVKAPAFIEATIGENRRPQTKDEAFAEILAKGMGQQGGVAMYKYCYVDIDLTTDVHQLFDHYSQHVNALRGEYPRLTIVHITMPLTTVEMDMRSWIKTVLGRPTVRDIAAMRNEFNNLIRQTYSGRDPIFDLAEVESTLPDGSRSYFVRGNEQIYTLAPLYAADDGHLNGIGRRTAAVRLLQLLADL